jgi:hypothetical protein
MNLPLYQVVEWNRLYENNKSRERDQCSFVCVPNDDGPAIAAILGQYEGLQIIGIWLLIMKLCSRQRRPREGYLTLNGRPDEWRLGADQLAHMWKVPAATIRRALLILSSPQVGYLKLLDGVAERPLTTEDSQEVPAETGTASARREGHQDCPPERAPQVPAEVPAETGTFEVPENVSITTLSTEVEKKCPPERAPQVPAETGTASARDDGYSRAHIERKKERKKEPSMVPHGGMERNAHVPADMNLEKTKQWLNSLFGRQVAWSYEEDYLLSECYPIAAKDRALLSWAYTAPVDTDGWVTIEGQRLSKRKQSILTLLRELPAEIDKWKGMRAQLNEDDWSPEPSGNGWTAERLQARQERFPEANWPERFDEVPIDVQRVIDRRAEQLVQKNE